jgi:putative FmdB family regulatory protein
MPIYEYKCESCGKTFTKLQKFSDEPLTMHEECGSGPVEKLISAPAFHFKGTGWYVTDYAKSSASNPAGEGKPASGERKSEGDKAETKSAESKPAETKSSSSDSTSSSSTKSETKPAS